ncbi:hypothetical protein evm_011104 [Chilo suppressalis]|nr:hypothetical protein evm_011104 [Chilo suppressalis]
MLGGPYVVLFIPIGNTDDFVTQKYFDINYCGRPQVPTLYLVEIKVYIQKGNRKRLLINPILTLLIKICTGTTK